MRFLVEIVINSKKHGIQKILLDDDDFEKVSKYNWYVKINDNVLYAYSNLYIDSKWKASIIMHRLILGVTDKKIKIDHKNHNGLDNRRENLRLCTDKQNMHNSRPRKNTSSKYKGVSKKDKIFIAQIHKDKTNSKLIGYFNTEEDAAKAYNIVAKKEYGEFAYLNNIDDWENFDIESNKRQLNPSSKYNGVFKRKDRKNWSVSIYHNNKNIVIGDFKSEQDAARAYNIKALELYGENYEYFNNIENWREFKIIPLKERTQSRYRGVRKFRNGSWGANIGHKGKIKYLGCFKTEKEAAIAYNKAALELKGDKAKLNKID